MIKADLETTGLPHTTDVGTRCFHSLRNSYISSLFDAGCSVATVQRLARHSDVKMTMRYAKPRTDEWEVVNDLAYPLATQSTTKSRGGVKGEKCERHGRKSAPHWTRTNNPLIKSQTANAEIPEENGVSQVDASKSPAVAGKFPLNCKRPA